MLTNTDLKQISAVVNDSIEKRVPMIIEEKINSLVSPIIDDSIQARVPPLIKKELDPVKISINRLSKKLDLYFNNLDKYLMITVRRVNKIDKFLGIDTGTA